MEKVEFPKIERTLDEGKRQCLICPHFCILRVGQVGSCGVRANMGNKISPINYGSMTGVSVEPIEKKPFRDFMPIGTKTLSFGSWGCNLKCQYCENHCISQVQPSPGKTKKFYPYEIVDLAKKHRCEAVCFTYNEPTITPEYIIDVAQLLIMCPEKIELLLKTNAFVNHDLWVYLTSRVSAVNIDWKGSESSFRDIAGVRPYVLEERIKEAIDNTFVEISIPLHYQTMEEMRESIFRLGTILSDHPEVPCHLLKIYPNYERDKTQTTPDAIIQAAKSILEKCGLKNIYIFKS